MSRLRFHWSAVICCFIFIHSLTGIASGSEPYIRNDTIKDNQVLYNGRVWRNLYLKIEGDQFLYTDKFLPGSVSVSSKEFGSLELKYDIYNDEILIKTNKGIIIQLNKELVDSFAVGYTDGIHHYRKLENDSTGNLDGYVEVLYDGAISLFVKYMKKIDPVSADKKYDNFYQIHRIYLEKSGIITQIGSKRDLYRIFSDYRHPLKDYIRSNKIRIFKSIPGSFIPVIAFCDKLGKTQ